MSKRELMKSIYVYSMYVNAIEVDFIFVNQFKCLPNVVIAIISHCHVVVVVAVVLGQQRTRNGKDIAQSLN